MAVEEEIKIVVHEQRHVVVYEVGCVEITVAEQVEMIDVESPKLEKLEVKHSLKSLEIESVEYL
jgi:hypothetical protein